MCDCEFLTLLLIPERRLKHIENGSSEVGIRHAESIANKSEAKLMIIVSKIKNCLHTAINQINISRHKRVVGNNIQI